MNTDRPSHAPPTAVSPAPAPARVIPDDPGHEVALGVRRHRRPVLRGHRARAGPDPGGLRPDPSRVEPAGQRPARLDPDRRLHPVRSDDHRLRRRPPPRPPAGTWRDLGAAAVRPVRPRPDRRRDLPGRSAAGLPGRHPGRTGRRQLARHAALRHRRHRVRRTDRGLFRAGFAVHRRGSSRLGVVLTADRNRVRRGIRRRRLRSGQRGDQPDLHVRRHRRLDLDVRGRASIATVASPATAEIE